MHKPGLYPASWPAKNENRGERQVHAALRRHLPKSMYAWHSLKLRDDAGHDGEGDFVLADPARGLLVLEVKSGRIEKREGMWLQNGREMKKSPREQARSFASKLSVVLRRKGYPGVPFGCAVCFPDVDSGQGITQGDLEGVVLGSRDLLALDHALPALLDRALPRRPVVDDRWVRVLHDLWDETWVPRVSLAVRAAHEELDRVELDQEQLKVLDSCGENDRMLVTGPAGSGKTLLAAEVVRRFRASGARTALLCFTDALAAWLEHSLRESGVEVYAIRRYAAHILEAYGGVSIDPGDSAAWENAPIEAAAIVERHELGFDAVVVDEAQDLSAADWMLVSAMVGEGKLWAFRDPAQAFWNDREVDRALFSATHLLTRCYRNPKALWEVAKTYGGGQDIAPAFVREAVSQQVLAVITCPSEESVPRQVERELKRLIAEGFKPNEIAIISMLGQDKSQVLKAIAPKGLRVVKADHPEADSAVIADTFLRFKGLERKAVILTDLPVQLHQRERRMHIGLTRALATARVVASREAVDADPVLRASG